ncbi:MAG: hypothetical protein KAS30_05130 [Candidatus Diapherotrites archaeon]|nr:hypothetical protein [Candidatus Diapherotrites archaeon]
MTNTPAKNVSTTQLKKELSQELKQLAITNSALKAGYGSRIEILPSVKGIEKIVEIMSLLHTRGEKIAIPIKMEFASPELWAVFENNPKVGKFFQQAAFKEELLKKHGYKKLKKYKMKKKTLPKPMLHKKKPF